MLVLEQPVLQRAAMPALDATEFPGESCRNGRERAIDSVPLVRTVSITGEKTGAAQEASHLQ
jgi:hypothetical protein